MRARLERAGKVSIRCSRHRGKAAKRLLCHFKERGTWVHMGRVNSYERTRYARWLGCDSIDGTQFSWFRDTKLPPALNALRQEEFSGI